MTGFQPQIPIVRGFNKEMARAFYINFLGFTVQFEHRFFPNAPLYMGIERDGCVLHLSEHLATARRARSFGSRCLMFMPMQRL